MKRYTLKAVNDEETTCFVCGKVELKRVMWLAELNADGEEIGDPFHCGTSCGARLMGRKLSHVTKVVNNFEATVNGIRWDLQTAKETELGLHTVIAALNKETKRFAERRQHPLWAKVQEIKQAAKEYADSQMIKVEI